MRTSYISKPAEKTEVNLEPETIMAIKVYTDLVKAEKKVEKLEKELTSYVLQLQGEQLAAYVSMTDELNKE